MKKKLFLISKLTIFLLSAYIIISHFNTKNSVEKIEKSIFIEENNLEVVNHMDFVRTDTDEISEFVFAENKKAIFFDKNLNKTSQVTFRGPSYRIRIVPPEEKEKKYRFLNIGSWKIPPSLFDHQGKQIWSPNKVRGGVNDSCAVDINNDGNLEFLIAYNGKKGIDLLDHEGDLIWKKDASNVWKIAVTDSAGRNDMRILHSNARGELIMRDKNGSVIRRTKADNRINFFSLTPWPEKNSPDHVVFSTEKGVHILNIQGEEIEKFPGSAHGKKGQLTASLFKTEKGRTLFAANITIPLEKRTLFIVYSKDGEIVFEDALEEICPSIKTIPAEKDNNSECVLLGCENKIYLFGKNCRK